MKYCHWMIDIWMKKNLVIDNSDSSDSSKLIMP